MTLLGVFSNVADRRTALMAQIEAFLDNVLVAALRSEPGDLPAGGGIGSAAGAAVSTEALEQIVDGFGQSVAQLQASSGTSRRRCRTSRPRRAIFASSTCTSRTTCSA